MASYYIKFSYDTPEGRAFYDTTLQAESRAQAFDNAITEFNQSIRLEQASENGRQYYYNTDF